MVELYVSLTNMYWLVCVMQDHKMRKIDKIISDLSVEQCKILMGKCRGMNKVNEKILFNMIIFFEFPLIIYLGILDDMFQTIY